MVNMRKGFGGASGAAALEATGGVTKVTFMGRAADLITGMTAKATTPKAPAANTPKK